MNLKTTKKIGGNRRGVAMILVLTAITILSAFSAEFSYRARIDVHMSSNLEKEIQAYYHARSVIEITRLAITSQKFIDQAVNMFSQMVPGMQKNVIEIWPFACKFVEVFSNKSLNFLGTEILNLKDFEGIGVSQGGMSCEIIPEDAKINVNQVATVTEKKNLFMKLFALLKRYEEEFFEKDERKMMELILNIMDWVDIDDSRTDIDSNGNFVDAGGMGENTGYSKHGLKSKNAKFDTIEELRLVEGMNDDLFCKFSRELTVYNTERINVNEASIELLKALICQNLLTDPLQACFYSFGPVLSPIDEVGLYIDMCRNIKKTLFAPPFNSEKDFVSFFSRLPERLSKLIKVNENMLQQYIGVKSRVLRIKAKGYVGTANREIQAVIDTSTARWMYWNESGVTD
jgi:general secretion pathway protein K